MINLWLFVASFGALISATAVDACRARFQAHTPRVPRCRYGAKDAKDDIMRGDRSGALCGRLASGERPASLSRPRVVLLDPPCSLAGPATAED